MCFSYFFESLFVSFQKFSEGGFVMKLILYSLLVHLPVVRCGFLHFLLEQPTPAVRISLHIAAEILIFVDR